ncbi:MAG: hypothetical protein OEY20_04760 [Gemmatimonadota bacterium]|nr:hypothetical protein [Gemmatimonadota bacterium]MDH5196540.1 hypothetical protein [Gemmatimonadota bacterium]
MGHYTIVLSNPPQNGVDAESAAPLLGLTPEQFTAKARYIVPEIWFAHPDEGRARELAGALQTAKCRVSVVDSSSLVAVPQRSRVRSFSFTERGLVAHLDGEDAEVSYDQPVRAVFCRPREGSERTSLPGARRSSSFFSIKDRLMESGSTLTDVVPEEDTVPFLDIYMPVNGEVRRYTVQQNAVNFSGLGRVQPRAASNMEALVGSCEDRFGVDHVDKRLVGMRLRARIARRAPGAEHRRGFSFASPGLLALLAALEQGLERVSQPELSTRLAFLAYRYAA